MKKYLLTFAMGLLLALALAPAAFAANQDTTDLQNAINGANGTLTLNRDYNIDATINITDGITINGNGHSVSLNNSDSNNNWAFSINTTENVELNDIVINAIQNNKRGVYLQSSSFNVEMNDATINANKHGIASDGAISGSVLTINDSKILNSNKPAEKTYDNWAMSGVGDYRGISLYNTIDITVNINRSDILGFGYGINLSGPKDSNGRCDFNGTDINVDGSAIKGWTTFNVWSANTIFNILNTDLKGINMSNGGSDAFATIVVNDDIYGYGWLNSYENVFNITNGSISNAQYGSAEEMLFRVDSNGITQVNFLSTDFSSVTIEDKTGNVPAVFFSPVMTADDMINFINSRVTGHENCDLISPNGSGLAWGSIPQEG